MALFVFGAGATRGSSFVHETENPCLPFLDADFFTQLQRVRHPKHQKLIGAVIRDVVGLFGHNFDVTMESVFTTLEHMTQMVGTTGEKKAFQKKELLQKKKRLEQAIAVVLEEAITKRDTKGHPTIEPKECNNHSSLVREILKNGDDVLSYNYDCMLDHALKQHGDGKWNARYGYGFNLGSKGSNLTGDNYWQPVKKAQKKDSVHLYKLHGSLHFDISDLESKTPKIKLKERPYTKQKGDLHFTIIPPEWNKKYNKGVFSNLWKKASDAIVRAEHMVFIGYSMPYTDLHSTSLFRVSVKAAKLKSLVIVNPDKGARHRIRSILQRGMSEDTRVLSFDRFEHFAATKRELWDMSNKSDEGEMPELAVEVDTK